MSSASRGGAGVTHALDFEPEDADAIRAYIAERIYEFNVQATGYADGRELTCVVRDDDGTIVAGLCGHTWGGYAEAQYLWVHERSRGTGVGSRLLAAAEHEAAVRGCELMVLSSHSFQAPGFYLARGYTQLTEVRGAPRAHANVLLVKRLTPIDRG